MRECLHGQLARSCDLCEKDKRIAELEAELAASEARLEEEREVRDRMLSQAAERSGE